MGRMAIVLAGLAALLGAAPARAAEPPVLWHRTVTIDTRVAPNGIADAIETWDVRGDTTALAHTIAQQSFSYVADLDAVEIVEAYTRKADGTRIAAGPGAVMEQAVGTGASAPQFSVQRARTIVFPGVGAGDTVHYVLRRRGVATLFPGHLTVTMQPGQWANLDRVDLSVALPPGMAIKVETVGLEEAPPLLSEDGGMLRRWRRGTKPAGQVLLDASSFADYAALGDAYARRAVPRSQPGPAVRALAARLTADVADPRDQALRLYRHVATEIRYVALFLGQGRVVPRDAETVLAEGYGDCKDHAALLQALLAARGIEAMPALISLRALYALPAAPGLGALNHVITYVPSLDLFLDSTAPYAPFGLLPAGEYDKPVVLAAIGAARLSRTPALPPAALDLRTTTEARIGADDVLTCTTVTEAAGPQAIALRSMAAWIEGRGLAGAASVQLRYLGTPGTGGFSFNPPERDGAAYQVRARFTLSEPLLDGGEAPFPLPGGLGVFDRPGKVLLGSALTEDGRHVCYPGREVEELTLTLPDGAELRGVPADVSVQGGGARYEASYRVHAGALRVRREFTVTTARVACSPAEYAAMAGVLAAARRDQRVQVTLERPD